MSIDVAKFTAWLREQGASVEATTSSWEVVRFRAFGKVHVIYRNKNGSLSMAGFPMDCLAAFKRNQPMAMGFARKRKCVSDDVRAALLERDGNECFFCAQPMPDDDMTVEHLVALVRGGPNHMDNFALTHSKCNQAAGKATLMAKIRMYCEARKALADFSDSPTPSERTSP